MLEQCRALGLVLGGGCAVVRGSAFWRRTGDMAAGWMDMGGYGGARGRGQRCAF
jgi:hypothetical protein